MAVLSELQAARGLGMLFITHDLDLAAAVTDSLAVMYAGTVVETGPTTASTSSARAPYTAALWRSRPSTAASAGCGPSPAGPMAAFETGAGCVFVARCPFAADRCRAAARACASSATTPWPATAPRTCPATRPLRTRRERR